MSDKKTLEKLSNFVIFKTTTGKVNIDVFFQDETLWLSQKGIADLYDKGRSTITEHLKNIFNLFGSIPRCLQRSFIVGSTSVVPVRLKSNLHIAIPRSLAAGRFIEGELDENSVCRDLRQTADDGKEYKLKSMGVSSAGFYPTVWGKHYDEI